MDKGKTFHGMNHLNQESGFSLVEVLMATFLLVLGILAYGKTSASVMGTNVQSTKESTAITLAQDLLEEFKNTGFTIGTGTETVDTEGNPGAAYTPYTRTWTNTDVGGRMYDLEVTVSWIKMGTRSVTLKTRVTD